MKVRRRDRDALPRRHHRRQIEIRHRLVVVGRRIHEVDERRRRGRGDRRIHPRAGEDLAGGAGPDVGERRLQAGGHRPRDLEHHVAPVVGILRVAKPLVLDGHAAGESDLPVDDDGAAVIAAMEARPTPELRRPERRDAAAGLLEIVEALVGRADRRQPVEQHANLDAVLLPLDERFEHAGAHLAVPPHEDAEVDRRSGRAQPRQERRVGTRRRCRAPRSIRRFRSARRPAVTPRVMNTGASTAPSSSLSVTTRGLALTPNTSTPMTVTTVMAPTRRTTVSHQGRSAKNVRTASRSRDRRALRFAMGDFVSKNTASGKSGKGTSGTQGTRGTTGTRACRHAASRVLYLSYPGTSGYPAYAQRGATATAASNAARPRSMRIGSRVRPASASMVL